MKRAIFAIIITGFILTGCAHSQRIAYQPTSFGENGHCYYVDSPYEAQELIRSGMCPSDWIPYPISPLFHQRYFNYYASPSYYRVYVPVASRSSYASSEKSWGSSNRTAIATESKTATYKGSNGKTVTADKIGVAKYGGGSRFGPVGTKFGGGSGRVTNSPAPASPKVPSAPSKPATPAPKSSPAPHSSPSPSKSYGGGSGRSYSGGGSRSYGGGGRR